MATRITYRASVSFESDSAPVLTHRVEITATTAQKAASLAVKGARQAFRGKSPRSIVVVLEEVSRAMVPGVRKFSGLPGGLHPVDVAILGGDPSL